MHQLFAELLGVDQSELHFDDLHQKFRRGLISDKEFFAELHRRYPDSPEIDAEAFVQSFERINLAQVEPLYELAKALRAHDIRTGILSNIYGISARWLKSHGFYDGFDPIVLSCDEKAAKPDSAIYEAALRQLGERSENVLLIDDQTKCLPPAQALSMHTILAESPEQVVADMRKLLKTENNLELALQ